MSSCRRVAPWLAALAANGSVQHWHVANSRWRIDDTGILFLLIRLAANRLAAG
jgi:hypothetical protein